MPCAAATGSGARVARPVHSASFHHSRRPVARSMAAMLAPHCSRDSP
ncbi:hypothetical protein [Streptomyces sp. H34-S4]|nr:hypothetical protein [Streptomyces sp. H34-S4]MCY0934848.1 hypothetical protein [Streptomyces sp. H34-S4]